MIGIVVSRADSASVHVWEQLQSLRDWTEREDDARPGPVGGGTVYRSGPFEVRTFAKLHLELDGAAAVFDDPDLIAFASRHSGETGPLLTAHFTGNFGPAEFGGDDRSLATAAPAALDRVVTALDDHAPEGYETGIECTHHGPSDVGAPSLFVELGSDVDEWEDPEGAEAVARAILDLAGVDAGSGRALVGIGGGHYAPRFERIRRETGWRVGHVAADWALEAMGDPEEGRDVLRAVFEASGADHAVVDGDHPEVAATVEALGYRVVSETWVREADGVPLELVADVEDELGPVGEGLRFGDPAAGYDGDFERVALPDGLLAEALGTDADATRAAAAETLLAYQTEENGNRPQGRAAVRSRADLDALVDPLVGVLDGAYDEVAVRDGAVVAREAAFDPELARELGVEPGPAFGRLADGEPVEVDGETVAPDDVTAERTRRFEL